MAVLLEESRTNLPLFFGQEETEDTQDAADRLSHNLIDKRPPAGYSLRCGRARENQMRSVLLPYLQIVAY